MSLDKYRRAPAAALATLRPHRVALAVFASAIAVYALVGFLLVPHVARRMAQSYVSQELGRHLSLGDFKLNPFTLQAVVTDLTLTEADGKPLLAFGSLRVNGELAASLWHRAIVLKQVQLDRPDVDVVVARDGSVNLLDLVPKSAERSSTAPAVLPRVHIGALNVTAGRIGLQDHTHDVPFATTLAPIHFSLTDFRTDLDYRNEYAFQAATAAGEQLEWNGDFTVKPFGSAGRFAVRDLRGETLASYLQQALPFQLVSGTATLHGGYRIALDPQLLFEVQLPSIIVRNIAVAERAASPAAPVISMAEVKVEDVGFSYGQRSLTIKNVAIDGARITTWREPDGDINLLRLTQAEPNAAMKVDSPAEPTASATNVAAEAPAPAIPTWQGRLERLQIQNSAILAEDRAVSPHAVLKLEPLSLTVSSLSSDLGAKVRLQAAVAINERGQLQLDGEIRPRPLDAQLQIALSNFDLVTLQPYIAQFMAVTLQSGRGSVTGALEYAQAAEPLDGLKFAGDIVVDDFRTIDPLREEFIKFRQLAATKIRLDRAPTRLSIDRIAARQPYAKVVIAPDASLNVTKVLNSPSADSAARTIATERHTDAPQKAAAKPRETPVRIKSVRIIDGAANFADYSIQPSFAAGILGLNGSVTGLSTNPASRAKVVLDGKVDRYAPVEIRGEVNLLAATAYTDLALNFRNMELTTFNPYSGKFAGYSISKGKLSTELKYVIQDRALAAEHHVVVDNLEFGAKTDSKDAAPIPVKLAVALLKDRNGIIDIQLPVRGTLDDPTFRLGPIIWKAVLGLLTKIVTAPFAALGALFGGGEELAFVDFPSGSAALESAQREKLEKLAAALVERPQLKLDVPLTLLNDQDAASLARQALDARAPQAASDQQDDAAKRVRLNQLAKTYKDVAGQAPAYPPPPAQGEVDLSAQVAWLESALLEKLNPPPEALDALARARADAVQAALLTNTSVAPERVFITSDRSAVTTTTGGVRMEMKLE